MKTLERELQLHPVKASQAQVMRLRGARFRGASGEGKHGRIEGVGEGAFEADDVQHDYAVWDTVGSLEDDEPGDDEAVAEGSSGQLVLPAVWPAVHDAADYATGGRAVELTTAMAAELSPEARRRHEQKLERYRQAKATAEAEMRKAAKAAKAERELQLKIARAQGPKHFKQWLEEQKAKETEQLSLAGLYPEEEGPEEDWDDTGPADVMARTVK